MEVIYARYRCECGFTCTEDDPERSKREEHFDREGFGHLGYPEDLPGYALDCENDCEHDGCDLSDCLATAQDLEICAMCGGPARVYILPEAV